METKKLNLNELQKIEGGLFIDQCGIFWAAFESSPLGSELEAWGFRNFRKYCM